MSLQLCIVIALCVCGAVSLLLTIWPIKRLAALTHARPRIEGVPMYDDHSYCPTCGKHEIGCYCFHNSPPDAEDGIICRLNHEIGMWSSVAADSHYVCPPDPRPSIAAKLDRPFVFRMMCMDPVYARKLLDDEIPEGAPWTVYAPIEPYLNSPISITNRDKWKIQAAIPDEWSGADLGVPWTREQIAAKEHQRITECKAGSCHQCAPGYGHNNPSYTPDGPHDGPWVQW